jgi:hypothetical protein
VHVVQCVTTGEDAGWEDGGNREFTIWGPDYSLDIRCRWGLTDDTEIQAAALPRNGQADFPTLASLRAADLAAEEAAELLRAKLKDKKKALAGSATNGSKPSPAAATPAAAVAEDNGQSRDEAREQRDREKEAERRERKEREAREREQQREQTEAQRVLAAAAAASNGSSSNGSSSSPEVGVVLEAGLSGCRLHMQLPGWFACTGWLQMGRLGILTIDTYLQRPAQQ